MTELELLNSTRKRSRYLLVPAVRTVLQFRRTRGHTTISTRKKIQYSAYESASSRDLANATGLYARSSKCNRNADKLHNFHPVRLKILKHQPPVDLSILHVPPCKTLKTSMLSHRITQRNANENSATTRARQERNARERTIRTNDQCSQRRTDEVLRIISIITSHRDADVC